MKPMTSGGPTSRRRDAEKHTPDDDRSPSWTDIKAAATRALVELQEQNDRPNDRHRPLSGSDVRLLTRLHAELDEVAVPERSSRDIPPEVDRAAMTLLLAAIARLQRDDDDLLVMTWQVQRHRTPSEAARSGFARGLMDSVSWDFFGDDEFLQARHLIAHREDALQRDWFRVTNDWRNALARIYEQLRQELKDLSERQGTLFPTSDIEHSIERH